MGREAFISVLGWLTISGALAVNNLVLKGAAAPVLKDNVSAASAPRLYRNPQAVYAAPYGAYSFHLPAYAVPRPAASRVVPVRENPPSHPLNSYLKDSYGNRFVQALQSIPFKPFPQQYVQLQELPAHFAQPLSAAPASSNAASHAVPHAASHAVSHAVQHAALHNVPHTISYAAPHGYHYRAVTPHVAGSPPQRSPQQAGAPSPINYGHAHTGLYAGTFKDLSQSFMNSALSSPFRGPTYIQVPAQAAPTRPDLTDASTQFREAPAHQQPAGNGVIYGNTHPQEYHLVTTEPKFQRLEDISQESYSTVLPTQEYRAAKREPKYHRSEESIQESPEEEEPLGPPRQLHKTKAKLKTSSITVTPVPTVVNGKKTIVNVETKPPIPLLDISLLEPLTFANPLVPQIQNYLPRISEAKYHKLPELTKNDGKKLQKEFGVHKVIKGKPKKVGLKKKHKTPEDDRVFVYDDYVPQATARPTVTVKAPEDAPEFSYEINSPNYKETYKEQAVKYNKETNSEPVNYSYGTNTHKEPVRYSYVHSSKEPVHIKEVRYEGTGEGPKHLIHKFSSEEHNGESEPSKLDSEDSNESSEHSDDDTPSRSHHRDHEEHHNEAPKTTHSDGPEHREQEYHHKPSSNGHHDVQYKVNSNLQSPPAHQQEHHHKPSSDSHYNVHHNSNSNSQSPSTHNQEHHHTPSSNSLHNANSNSQGPPAHSHEYHHTPLPVTHSVASHGKNANHQNPPPAHYYTPLTVLPFQPVAHYEENIRLSAPIKVDPKQHIQKAQPVSKPPQQPHQSPQQQRSSPAPQHHYKESQPKQPHDETPPTYVQEKTKQVYIKEETPQEHSFGEQLVKSMLDSEDEKEQDFEKAYKNAAFGFPAYQAKHDLEQDIFDPESYGVPREHSDFDIDHSPFQQYTEQGDDFPKAMSLSYKDELGKMKEDYFLDYSVSKPESLTDRYKNKVNYYKLFKNQKPEKYVAHDNSKNNQKQSEKFTALPYGLYPVQDQKMKELLAQYKTGPFVSSPLLFEYDYSKGLPKDNSAFASRPLQQYKVKTHFVEPQFQYGFEPLALPRLLDSELSAMATNNSPETPGTRKKIYKENFYIKKTSTDAGSNS